MIHVYSLKANRVWYCTLADLCCCYYHACITQAPPFAICLHVTHGCTFSITLPSMPFHEHFLLQLFTPKRQALLHNMTQTQSDSCIMQNQSSAVGSSSSQAPSLSLPMLFYTRLLHTVLLGGRSFSVSLRYFPTGCVCACRLTSSMSS